MREPAKTMGGAAALSRMGHMAHDEVARDKYGFQNDEKSLHDAFALRAIKFREPIPENNYQQVVLQNSRVWIFT